MEKITSSNNARIKRLLQLHRSRGRQKQQRIVIFGEREIERAVDSGLIPDEVFICDDCLSESTRSGVLEKVKLQSCPVLSLPEDLFLRVCFGDRSDGIIMTARRPELTAENFFAQLARDNPFIGVVESVEKPGNLGAIMRSADGAALDGLMLCDRVTDWFHPNTIRASLGTCFSVPGSIGTSNDAIDRLSDSGFQIVVASLQASRSFYDLDLMQKTAVVLGNEAHGVTDVWRRDPCVEVKLPMLGVADSLNISATAAIMFYEARRQRS